MDGVFVEEADSEEEVGSRLRVAIEEGGQG